MWARLLVLRRRLALGALYARHSAAERIARSWRGRAERVSLATVQRRLELQLAAMYGRAMSVEPTDRPLRVLDRLRVFLGREPRAADAMPVVDGDTIRLPAALTVRGGHVQALSRYRLFAVEQAERLARGTAAHVPAHDPLERDLFLLREAAAIDATIARAHPGMIGTLERERRLALDRRPTLDRLTPLERDVELMVRDALARPADALAIGALATHDDQPGMSRAWARETANRIRTQGARYRGLPPAPLWGTIARRPDGSEPPPQERANDGPQVRSSIQLMTGAVGVLDMETFDGRAGRSSSGAMERDAEAGDPGARPNSEPSGEPGPHHADQVQTEYDLQREHGDRGASGPGAFGRPSLRDDSDDDEELPPPLYYDEWNADRGSYVKRGAAVRLYEPEERDASNASAVDQMLGDHASLVRQVRHQFERLRARRTLLGRQRTGDELDVSACIEAIVDRHVGAAPDDRLYQASRPARRGLAIALLADASGSTQTKVSGTTRVIDVERIALLLATEALDALGDLYAVYAFAGKSATNVKLETIKRFDQRNDRAVRPRIASIEPGGFTRLGAAVRHATSELARQTAGHRLLLILSDGRPNDIDAYQGTYGVEDSRQAILEARASGVFPFCITVDANASEYLPRIFGMAGHVIVRHPAQLPSALLSVVTALIRRG